MRTSLKPGVKVCRVYLANDHHYRVLSEYVTLDRHEQLNFLIAIQNRHNLRLYMYMQILAKEVFHKVRIKVLSKVHKF